MDKKNNKTTLVESLSFQESYNDRFGCCICLGPKLRMVTGHCQHRICEECLYEGQERRQCMQNCPICSYTESFPKFRPVIPTSTIEMQVCLGVQKCPRKGCTAQLWFWEVDEHLKICDTESEKTANKKMKLSKTGNEMAKTPTPSGPLLSPRRSRHLSEHLEQVNVTPARSHAVRMHSRNQRRLNSNNDQSTSSESAGACIRSMSGHNSRSQSQRPYNSNSDRVQTSSQQNKRRSVIEGNNSRNKRLNNSPTEQSITSSGETSQRVDRQRGRRVSRSGKETNNRLDSQRLRSRSCRQNNTDRAVSPGINHRSHVQKQSRNREHFTSRSKVTRVSSGDASRCSSRVLRNSTQLIRR